MGRSSMKTIKHLQGTEPKPPSLPPPPSSSPSQALCLLLVSPPPSASPDLPPLHNCRQRLRFEAGCIGCGVGGGGDTFSGACRSIRCAALGHSGCHVSPSVRSGARERLQVLVDLHVCFPTRRPLQGTRACLRAYVCICAYVSARGLHTRSVSEREHREKPKNGGILSFFFFFFFPLLHIFLTSGNLLKRHRQTRIEKKKHAQVFAHSAGPTPSRMPLMHSFMCFAKTYYTLCANTVSHYPSPSSSYLTHKFMHNNSTETPARHALPKKKKKRSRF